MMMVAVRFEICFFGFGEERRGLSFVFSFCVRIFVACQRRSFYSIVFCRFVASPPNPIPTPQEEE